MAFSYLISHVRHISRNVCRGLHLPNAKLLYNIDSLKINKILPRLASTKAVLENNSTHDADFSNDNKDYKIYKPSTPQAWITSLDGEPKGIVELDRRVFTANPRLDIMHRYVVWQLAKRRAGTAKTKNRGEVRGGGRKPWPQKHTGRARQGSIRAPHFRGGGVTHGPRPRSYDFTLPRKVRSMALRVALSVKFTQGDLHIVDSLCLEDHKTQRLKDILDNRQWYSVLFVDGNTLIDRNLRLASKNIPNCDSLPSMALNVHMMLKRHTLVLSLHAVKLLQERLVKDLAEQTWDKYDFKMSSFDSSWESDYYTREVEELNELQEL